MSSSHPRRSYIIFVKRREEASQTSDESSDESYESDDEEEDYNSGSIPSPSTSSKLNVKKTLGRSILSRLTSAHIRRFVSPDFKGDSFYNFRAPSLAIVPKTKKKINNVPKKLKEFGNKIIVANLKKVDLEKNVNIADKTSKKYKDKMKKSILERLCTPTLSFILRTQKSKDTAKDKNNKPLEAPPSPCSKYRRNHHHQK